MPNPMKWAPLPAVASPSIPVWFSVSIHFHFFTSCMELVAHDYFALVFCSLSIFKCTKQAKYFYIWNNTEMPNVVHIQHCNQWFWESVKYFKFVFAHTVKLFLRSAHETDRHQSANPVEKRCNVSTSYLEKASCLIYSNFISVIEALGQNQIQIATLFSVWTFLRVSKHSFLIPIKQYSSSKTHLCSHQISAIPSWNAEEAFTSVWINAD